MQPVPLEAFLNSVEQSLTFQSEMINRAMQIRGGGNIESWTVVQYLSSYPQFEECDYYRELPYTPQDGERTNFVDLAFNVRAVYPGYPRILSEWKCKPSINALSTGFFEDIGKFADMLPVAVVPQLPNPYPVWVGVGPFAENLGSGLQTYDIGNGLGLYLSTEETWRMHNLVQYTSFPPVAPPQTPAQPFTLAG